MPHSTQQSDSYTLRQELRLRVVRFHFVKKDGSLRIAVGTTNPNYMPDCAKSLISTRKGPSSTSINFWDFLANGWRAVNSNSQIFIDDQINS